MVGWLQVSTLVQLEGKLAVDTMSERPEPDFATCRDSVTLPQLS
jgi:hypothetical protein